MKCEIRFNDKIFYLLYCIEKENILFFLCFINKMQKYFFPKELRGSIL
ncbi:hypothetical protein HMPREF9554_00052 [Treponema phagedenis F0421]|nr:hypothetical protein HMPREF9554_00052 [Treponema phagedenis F0421]